jgi:hypothetical protein
MGKVKRHLGGKRSSSEIIKEFIGGTKKLPSSPNSARVYNTEHFKQPPLLLIAMICKLYGEENCVHFKKEWTAMVHAVVE